MPEAFHVKVLDFSKAPQFSAKLFENWALIKIAINFADERFILLFFLCVNNVVTYSIPDVFKVEMLPYCPSVSDHRIIVANMIMRCVRKDRIPFHVIDSCCFFCFFFIWCLFAGMFYQSLYTISEIFPSKINRSLCKYLYMSFDFALQNRFSYNDYYTWLQDSAQYALIGWNKLIFLHDKGMHFLVNFGAG